MEDPVWVLASYQLIVAHMGGIDEIGVFVLPAVAVLVVMRWMEARSARRDDGDD